MSPNPTPIATSGILDGAEKTTSNFLWNIPNTVWDFISSNLPSWGYSLLIVVVLIALATVFSKIKDKLIEGTYKQWRIALSISGLIIIAFFIVSCGIIDAISFDKNKMHSPKFYTSTGDRLINECADKYNVSIDILKKTIKEKNIKVADNTKQSLENEARILSAKQ